MLVMCNESKNIMGRILMQVLKHLDICLCWDQTESTPVSTSTDGLGCHVYLFFLDGNRNQGTNWKVCAGVLYVTNLWQVGVKQYEIQSIR